MRFFKILNIFFILLLGILVSYAVSQFWVPGKKLDQIKITQDHVQNNSVENDAALSLGNIKPFSFYSEQIQKRDIFQLYVPVLEQKPVDTEVLQEQIDPQNVHNPTEFVQNLRLVGIVLDQTPEAIIEDLQTNETLFLHKGDQIREGVIEEIQESKVVFNYYGQHVEIIP